MTDAELIRPKTYYYEVYGLIVRSELELPELSPGARCQADVSIRLASLSDRLESPLRDHGWVTYNENSCLMRIDNVARFLIRHGCEIVVDRRVDRSRDRQTGAPLSDVRLFLLGSAFGALLHQRGDLPLHVSAVVASDDVWAFTGESGAGKSTIAGWLHYKKGWRMISDDVSVICPSHNEPLLYPGPRKLKLWEDAVSLLDLKGEKLVQDLTNTPKYQLYLSDTASFAPKSLRYLVLLERDEAAQGAALTRLTGVEAFNACMAAVYRPYMAEWFRPGGEVMRNLLSLCEKISVFRYRRSWSLDLMCSEIEMISDRIARDSEVSE